MAAVTEAHAQSKVDANPEASEVSSLTDIVVTARKREERLQDVPVAVTAITAEGLEKSHITNITDLGSQATNVNISSFANLCLNVTEVIRGIGTLYLEQSSEPSVPIIIDGVAYESTYDRADNHT